jgi:hypothetical protein
VSKQKYFTSKPQNKTKKNREMKERRGGGRRLSKRFY